jgi:catechol-2,3-dioxygenase
MIAVKRIRHATFATADIEAQLEYYQSIIGLGVVARQDGRAYLASESEELTLVLEQDAVAGCKAMAFEVGPRAELRDLGKQLQGIGVKSDIRRTVCPGYPRF